MRRSEECAQLIAVIFDHAEYEQESAVRDILSDLMHYCDKHNKSFYNELYVAQEHYKEELRQEELP